MSSRGPTLDMSSGGPTLDRSSRGPTLDEPTVGAGDGRIAWAPSEEDALAEVHHVDGARRPWRAAVVALGCLALGATVAPRPISLAAVALTVGAAVLAAVAAWRFPLIRSGRTAAHPAASREITVEVGTDPRAVTLWRGGLERRLAPWAIEQLVVGADHVFLHLVGAEVLTIPCRVFGERGGLDRFVARVERFRRDRHEPRDGPDPGCDAWTVAYELPGAGVGLAGGIVDRRDGDLARIGILFLSFGSWLAMLASTEPWRGGTDLLLFGLFGVIGAVMVAAARPRRAPEGAVRLAVGPAGGWMHTQGGSTRFGWEEVLGIEVTPPHRTTVLRFADRVLPVPREVFDDDGHRRAFTDDVELWWEIARGIAPTPATIARVPLGPTADPFDPPRGG